MGPIVVEKPRIVLPTQRSEVDDHWFSQKTGVIGPPGIGKSEFFSHGDKTLYIQTEAGLNHLRVMKVPVRSWDDFREVYTQLLQASPFPYDTIVIDTIDKFVDLANQEAMERGRQKFKNIEINTVGDIPNGAGWAWATDLVENALGKLEELPAHIIFIGHLEMKEVKLPTSSIHKLTISIGGRTGSMLMAWCDHILNIQAVSQGTKSTRTIKTIPTSTLEAKSRGGMVLDGWVWSEVSADNYTKFRSFFK